MTHKVPFLDLSVEDPAHRQALLDAIERVLTHGQILLGPEVEQLEEEISEYCGKQEALGVGSGTTALYLAMEALDLPEGSEVIVPALSWIATANAVARAGAKPVFADINDELNLDPSSVQEHITDQTAAILPVHYTGKISQMDAILEIAEDHNLTVVEDASQAFGARRGNSPAGSFGHMACFSMNPMKVLPALGEAGMILADDPDHVERARVLRYNGIVDGVRSKTAGMNGRIDTLQAAVLLARLERTEDVIQRRRDMANQYNEALADIVKVPEEGPNERRAYYTYTIQTGERDELYEHLIGLGIEAKIRNPYLMPQQPLYVKKAQGEYPNAKSLVGNLLSIPCHEGMDEDAVRTVVEGVCSFFDGGSR